MSKDHDLGVNTSSMTIVASDADIQGWSDEKKKDFVTTFKKRALAAQYILAQTARRMEHLSRERHFISGKHNQRLDQVASPHGEWDHHQLRIGDRTQQELDEIANERANQILSELPSVKEAVKVIRPDVAKMMDQRDALIKKGEKLAEALQEISGDVSLADVDQDMTIGAFRKFMKDRGKKKRQIVIELDELGREGVVLESQINKALYAGLPGLTEAVIKVINQHYERVTAFEQTGRRVEERVMFGDSLAAMTMLQTFEKDEVHVSDTVRAEFKLAIGRLQLAGKKRGKK